MISHHRRLPTAAVVAQRRSERGVIILVSALVMVSLLTIAAIVVDLGYVRVGAGFNQRNADFAALAGGEELSHGDFTEACKDIISYVNANMPNMPAIDAATFCVGWENTVCTEGGTVAQLTPKITKGAYTVELRFPVPDSEIDDTNFATRKNDGVPCERITVKLTSQEPSFFGGIIGEESYTVTRSATVRGGGLKTRLVPALWLLDPVGCPVLTVQGGSKVIAGDVSNPNKINPGVITLDTDGTSGCSTTNTALLTGGSGTEVRAIPLTGADGKAGAINIRAMPLDAISCTGGVACNQADVNTRVWPQPRPAAERSTRAPVDWAWNCKATYPTYKGIAIEGCPFTATSGPYLDTLTTKVGIGTGLPSGFNRWSTSYSCSPSGTITVSGNWLVDCPGTMGLTNGTTLNFNGNVVFANGLKINNGARVNINHNNPNPSLGFMCKPPTAGIPCHDESSSKAAYLYIRKGDLELGGGIFDARATMVFIGNTGFIKGTGGSPPTWTAPTEGPFGGLALWAEAAGSMTVSGGAGVSLRGTFFTPFADELTLTGGGNWGQQNAQFISYRLKVTGGSNLTMAPDPTSAVILPPAAASLIR